MNDYFALFDEPRRPWLDPDLLKVKFLARSSQLHPDRVHSAAESEKAAAALGYAELNAAFNCLRDPKERLAHLLQLELGAKPKDLQQMPDDLAEAFMEVAQLCQQADAFLTEKARAASPLLRVQMFERGQAWVERLTTLQLTLANRREVLIEQLKTLDAQWEKSRAEGAPHRKVLERLEELYRLLGFYTRWITQLQERMFRLTS